MATPALQLRLSSTVSVTGAKSSPLIHGACSELVTTHLSSSSESPDRVAMTAFCPASAMAEDASAYVLPA